MLAGSLRRWEMHTAALHLRILSTSQVQHSGNEPAHGHEAQSALLSAFKGLNKLPRSCSAPAKSIEPEISETDSRNEICQLENSNVKSTCIFVKTLEITWEAGRGSRKVEGAPGIL